MQCNNLHVLCLLHLGKMAKATVNPRPAKNIYDNVH